MADRKARSAEVAELKALVEELRSEIILLRASHSCHCHLYHYTPQPWYPSYPYTITYTNVPNQTVGASTTTTYVQNTAGGNYPSIGN
jgi:hypothetical protein